LVRGCKVLKLEKILDKHLRTDSLEARLAGNNQFAYLKGRSTDAEMHRLVAQVEKALFNKRQVLYAKADFQRAFSELKISAIRHALERHRVTEGITRWILAMLLNREVQSTLKGALVTKSVQRGCPQGGVLSPLLWNLVMDELLEGLKRNFPSMTAQAFADDVSIWQEGLSYDTIANRITDGLKFTKTWCESKGLALNPGKTDIIVFGNSSRRTIPPITYREFTYQGKAMSVT